MKANDKQVGGDHYQRFLTQHWDFAWEHDYDQFQYCITKYVDRHKYKNGLEDLYKAKHHLDKYIELLEARKRRIEDLQDEDLEFAKEEMARMKGYTRQG